MKSGMLNSLYDAFQNFGETGLTNPSSATSSKLIEISPPTNENTTYDTLESTGKLGYCKCSGSSSQCLLPKSPHLSSNVRVKVS